MHALKILADAPQGMEVAQLAEQQLGHRKARNPEVERGAALRGAGGVGPQLPCHVACAVLPGHCLLEQPHRPVSAPAQLLRGWLLTEHGRVQAEEGSAHHVPACWGTAPGLCWGSERVLSVAPHEDMQVHAECHGASACSSLRRLW